MPPNNHSVMSRFFAEVFLVFLNNIESQHIRYIVDLLVTAADDFVIWVRLFTAAFYVTSRQSNLTTNNRLKQISTCPPSRLQNEKMQWKWSRRNRRGKRQATTSSSLTTSGRSYAKARVTSSPASKTDTRLSMQRSWTSKRYPIRSYTHRPTENDTTKSHSLIPSYTGILWNTHPIGAVPNLSWVPCTILNSQMGYHVPS